MSGQEGTPNGVDRLARIEAELSEVRGYAYPAIQLHVEDVLALVEIAKAALVFLDEHQRQKGAVLGEFDFLVYDEMETRLRSALARLDSGATEENT